MRRSEMRREDKRMAKAARKARRKVERIARRISNGDERAIWGLAEMYSEDGGTIRDALVALGSDIRDEIGKRREMGGTNA